MGVSLEHVAVAFEADGEAPCRAALKAKKLTAGVKLESDNKTVLDLSDVAATASVVYARSAPPTVSTVSSKWVLN